MIDTNVAYPILALVAIYAAVFFLFPRKVAEHWARDVWQLQTIVQHFRIWEPRRVFVAGTGLTACLVLSPAYGTSIIFMVGGWLGLMCIYCVDALQIRAIARRHLSVG